MKRFLIGCFAAVLFVALAAALPARNQTPAKRSLPRGVIVYSAQVAPEEYSHDRGRYDLFLRAVPGGVIKRLTDHRAAPRSNLGGAITEPQLAPDGRRVLFLSDDANSPDAERRLFTDAAPYPYTFRRLWLVNVATGVVTPITDEAAGDQWQQARWSPDGRFFCAVQGGTGTLLEKKTPDRLFVFDARTLRKHQVAQLADVKQRVVSLFWSQGGDRLFFQSSGSPDLYAVSRQGGRPRVFISGQDRRCDYRISPQGRQAAFLQAGDKPEGAGGRTLHVILVDSGAVLTRVPAANPKGSLHLPQWSRDGKRLAMTERVPGGVWFLHVLDVAAGKGRVIGAVSGNADLPGEVSLLDWSRNARWLIVSVREGVNTRVLAVSVADGRAATLAEWNTPIHGLDWREEKM